MTEPNSAVVIVPLLSHFGEEYKKVSTSLVEISHEQTLIKQGESLFVGCWMMDELGLVSISRWRKSGTYTRVDLEK